MKVNRAPHGAKNRKNTQFLFPKIGKGRVSVVAIQNMGKDHNF